jgi:hypothetical protein
VNDLKAAATRPANEALNATENGIPFGPWDEVNQCNGDVVTFNGKLNIGFVLASNFGEHDRWQFHTVADGAGSLGHTYHGVDDFEQESNVGVLFPYEFTIERNVRMTSNDAPDMYLHFLVHMTINGVGNGTAEVLKGDPVLGDCKY